METQDILVKAVPFKVLAALEKLRAKRGLRSRAELIRQLLQEAAKDTP